MKSMATGDQLDLQPLFPAWKLGQGIESPNLSSCFSVLGDQPPS
jgi:hypothetical protein